MDEMKPDMIEVLTATQMSDATAKKAELIQKCLCLRRQVKELEDKAKIERYLKEIKF